MGTDTKGNDLSGLNMGASLVVARMASRSFLDGVEDVVIEVSTDGIIYDTENIDVAIQEVAQLNANDVEVVVSV